jgi:Protein of unknown function (DUF2934)
MKRQRHTEIIE